jgi:peptidoglycan/xylan/chitin deacetylase (PgdA/CDA1 family)
VAASVFREQMRRLASGAHATARLSDVLAGRGGSDPARPPVVLTFDDGYAEVREHAVPVLRELGLPAAVFPVLDPGLAPEAWGSAPALRAPLLAPADLRALEADGLEVGSHTLTHPRLTACDDVRLERELRGSRERLAALVDHPLPVIAYPFGDVDERVKRAARRAGYVAGLAVASGPLGLHADLFEIRRQVMGNSASEAYLAMKLSGAEKLYAWSKWKLKAGLGSFRRRRPDRAAVRIP